MQRPPSYGHCHLCHCCTCYPTMYTRPVRKLFTLRNETCNEDPSSHIPPARTPGVPSFHLRGQKKGTQLSTPRGAPKICYPTPVLLWVLKLTQDLLCLPLSPPLPAILQLCTLGSSMAGRHNFLYSVWAPYSHSPCPACNSRVQVSALEKIWVRTEIICF